jgi:hypothetical protein
MVDISLDDFLSNVNKRNTNRAGKPIDPNLIRRFDNPICQKCHSEYKQKYPGKPFNIKCSGIYDQRDYEEIQQKLADAEPDSPLMPIEDFDELDIREIYDVAYWGQKHIRIKDDNGHYNPFEPRDYQTEVLRCTAKKKVDRWARGLGKALSLDTKLPTPTGWTTIEAVQPGDVVVGANGEPANVTHITEVMHNHDCYKVEFSDGSNIVADAGHRWLVWDIKARRADVLVSLVIRGRSHYLL